MPPPVRSLLLGSLALTLSALTCSARATYSIVAADTRTHAVGGAGASCVYPSQVSIIYGVAPGFGAVHAQAQSNAAGRDRAVQLLAQGDAPAAVIAAITASSFDASAARRQYGVVDVRGQSAGYTGAQNMLFADDVQGSVDGYVYSVQGNILTGSEVLEQAVAGFEGVGCDLPARLLAALEAGARNGEGDTRCTGPSAIAANSAFIQVDLPGMPAGSYLKLSAGSGRGVDPLPALRSAFDRWRSAHPCGGVSIGVDAGAADASSGDAALPDAAGWLDASARDAATALDATSLLDGAAVSADSAAAPLDGSLAARDAVATAAEPVLVDAAPSAVPEAGAQPASGPAALPSDETDEDSGCRAGRAAGTAPALTWLLLSLLWLGSRASRRRS